MEFIQLLCAVVVFVNVFRCSKSCSLFKQKVYEAKENSTVELMLSIPASCIPENSFLKSIMVYDVLPSGAPGLFCQLLRLGMTEEGSCLPSFGSSECFCNNATGRYTIRVPVGKPGSKKMKVVCMFNGTDDKVQEILSFHVSGLSESSNPTTPEMVKNPGIMTGISVSGIAVIIIIIVITVVWCRRRKNVQGSNVSQAVQEDPSRYVGIYDLHERLSSCLDGDQEPTNRNFPPIAPPEGLNTSNVDGEEYHSYDGLGACEERSYICLNQGLGSFGEASVPNEGDKDERMYMNAEAIRKQV